MNLKGNIKENFETKHCLKGIILRTLVESPKSFELKAQGKIKCQEHPNLVVLHFNVTSTDWHKKKLRMLKQ